MSQCRHNKYKLSTTIGVATLTVCMLSLCARASASDAECPDGFTVANRFGSAVQCKPSQLQPMPSGLEGAKADAGRSVDMQTGRSITTYRGLTVEQCRRALSNYSSQLFRPGGTVDDCAEGHTDIQLLGDTLGLH